MPLVGGSNLRSALDAGKLRLEDVEIKIRTASALDYSRSLGGEVLRVRLTDFGLALAADEKRITQGRDQVVRASANGYPLENLWVRG